MNLYRIDFTAAADADLSTDSAGMPDPIRSLIRDKVLVHIEPCEHGKLDYHPAAYAEVRAREGDILKGTVQWCEGADLL